MIKLIVYLVVIGALVYAGSTVKLGKRTFFGHISAIWKTSEVQELKSGVEEKAGPAVERVKRGVKAGVDEADKDDVPATIDAAPLEVPPPVIEDAPPAPAKSKKKHKAPAVHAP